MCQFVYNRQQCVCRVLAVPEWWETYWERTQTSGHCDIVVDVKENKKPLLFIVNGRHLRNSLWTLSTHSICHLVLVGLKREHRWGRGSYPTYGVHLAPSTHFHTNPTHKLWPTPHPEPGRGPSVFSLCIVLGMLHHACHIMWASARLKLANGPQIRAH